jgi:hypothetical protein
MPAALRVWQPRWLFNCEKRSLQGKPGQGEFARMTAGKPYSEKTPAWPRRMAAMHGLGYKARADRFRAGCAVKAT